MFRGVLASLCTCELSFCLLEELDDERGELDDEPEDELDDTVLLRADDVLTFDEERGELDEEPLDIILLLEDED